MAENFANEYQTTLSADITNVATSFAVVSTTGAPAANFRIRVGNELMLVTAVAGTTFTVTRGIEGTTAAAHYAAAGADYINYALTASGASVSTPSGEFSGNLVGYAIDANNTTYWNAVSTVPNSLLLVDLGQSRLIHRIRLYQGAGSPSAESATALNIETSPDNSSWTVLENVVVAAGDQTFDLTTATEARYWRFDPTAGGANGWCVRTIELQQIRDTITHVLTAGGLAQALGSSVTQFDLLNSTKVTADTPDDDFDSTTLAVKWTVVGGASGTVALMETSTSVSEYDLTSRPGWLMLQSGVAVTTSMRQDYTLPDGASIVLALATASPVNAGDNMSAGISLNDNDTSRAAGTVVTMFYEQDTTAFNIQSNGTSSTAGVTLAGDYDVPEITYFRIVRSGLNYRSFVSFDGMSWTYMRTETPGAEFTNIWVFLTGPSALNTYAPIVGIPWIRQGTSDLDPWNPTVTLRVQT